MSLMQPRQLLNIGIDKAL